MDDLKRHHQQGKVCWDDHDVMDGRPTGVVRVSLGYMSTFEDVYWFLQFVRKYFVAEAAPLTKQQLPLGATVRVPDGDGSKASISEASLTAEASAAEQLPLCGSTAPPALAGGGTECTGFNSSIWCAQDGESAAPIDDSAGPIMHKAGPLDDSRTDSCGISAFSRASGRSSSPDADGGASSNAAADAAAKAQPCSATTSISCIIGSMLALPGFNSSTPALTDGGGSAFALPTADGSSEHGAAASCSEVSASSSASAEPPPPVGQLTDMYLYPIKSCAGQRVTRWPLGPNGLLFDREWAVVDQDSGAVLSQKACPGLVRLQARVDLAPGTLTVTCSHMPEALVLPLPRLRASSTNSASLSGSAAFSAPQPSHLDLQQQKATSAWFTQALGRPCTVVQQNGQRHTRLRGAEANPPNQESGLRTPAPASASKCGTAIGGEQVADVRQPEPSLGFANKGQFLLVNEASVEWASESAPVLHAGESPVRPHRFRPNLVVSGFSAFAEETWSGIRIGEAQLGSLGACPRCNMLQVDQESGRKVGPALMLALADRPRVRGRLAFGLLLSQHSPQGARSQAVHGAEGDGDTWLEVGQAVAAAVE